jgi:histidinol-phosphate phosphatase family protein
MKDIVIIMGYNAAGKSTVVKQFTDRGYTRLNRDTEGGSLDDLATKAHHLIRGGITTIVLDNTYATVESRRSIMKVAKICQIPIRCLLLTTSFEDAQLNACLRMVKDTGRLLMPEDFKKTKNPNHFPPVALFNYRKVFEKPTTAEGFVEVKEFPFVREWPSDYVNKALILDYDGNLRESLGEYDYPCTPSEVVIFPNRTTVIKKYQKDGYILLGASNQSGVAKKILSSKDADDCLKETNRQLGLDIDYQFCPHSIPPVSCYCRKPHPGMGAVFIVKYKLNPSECIFVGDQTSDKTFAERCGFQFKHTTEFFI